VLIIIHVYHSHFKEFANYLDLILIGCRQVGGFLRFSPPMKMTATILL